MSVLLSNVLFDAYRADYVPATGATTAPTPHLQGVVAHLGPLPATQYALVPGEVDLHTIYLAEVETGTDITTGDQIVHIVLLADGVTPWPGDTPPAGQPGANNVVYWVRFHIEATPGPLAARRLYLERKVLGGTFHP